MTVDLRRLLAAGLALTLCASSLAAAAQDEAVTAWVREQLVPIATLAPSAPTDDLQFLRGTIGDARIVALGESTHGTEEFFRLKHRLIRFLVQELGFTAVCMEASWIEGLKFDAQVLRGSPSEGTGRALFGVYTSVSQMHYWMGAYNKAAGPEGPLHVIGFDPQTMSSPLEEVVRYIDRAGVVIPSSLRISATAIIPDLIAEIAASEEPLQTDVDRCEQAIGRVREFLLANRDACSDASSREDFERTLQTIKVSSQQLASAAHPRVTYGSFNVRDKAMAENIAWWLDHFGEDARIVVWAHNLHIGIRNENGLTSMGWHLREWFGEDYLAIGLTFAEGSVRAVDGKSWETKEVELEPPTANSFERALQSSPEPYFVLDLRDPSLESDELGWLSASRSFRSIGAIYWRSSQWRTTNVPSVFDALFHTQQASAARI